MRPAPFWQTGCSFCYRFTSTLRPLFLCVCVCAWKLFTCSSTVHFFFNRRKFAVSPTVIALSGIGMSHRDLMVFSKGVLLRISEKRFFYFFFWPSKEWKHWVHKKNFIFLYWVCKTNIFFLHCMMTKTTVSRSHYGCVLGCILLLLFALFPASFCIISMLFNFKAGRYLFTVTVWDTHITVAFWIVFFSKYPQVFEFYSSTPIY